MSDKQSLKDTVAEYKKARKEITNAVDEAVKRADRTRQERAESQSRHD